ncbi:hypothetical protein [Actinoallomurus sp. CA-142502]|uniref:hypothetical protein n=1 Tax=Actinoallomurus sp. CA-142502 TaxID=3239885 RepID=UPI003D91C7E9
MTSGEPRTGHTEPIGEDERRLSPRGAEDPRRARHRHRAERGERAHRAFLPAQPGDVLQFPPLGTAGGQDLNERGLVSHRSQQPVGVPDEAG